MILFSKFGYALRHKFTYQPETKSGSLTLWSSYNGSYFSPNPSVNGGNPLSELFSIDSQRYGGNHRTEFLIGDENDVFSLLASLIMIKNGKEYSFSNYQDREISFSITETENGQNKIVIAKIHYSTNFGVLTLDEVNELEIITRNTLTNLGFSNQEIAEKLERKLSQSAN